MTELLKYTNYFMYGDLRCFMLSDDSYYFLCNPAANSGRMKKNWEMIEQAIRDEVTTDYTFEFTTDRGDTDRLVEHAMNMGYRAIIAVGGDGTANEILNALCRRGAESDINMGIIPAGTSNDTNINHNLQNDPVEVVKLLKNPNMKKFGIGRITGDFGSDPYYFIDHCDTGLAAMAARSALHGSSFLKGTWKYTYYALKNIVRFKLNHGRVKVDNEEFSGEFAVIAIGLGREMAGYKLWPNKSTFDNEFAVLLARNFSRLGLLKLMLAAEKGEHIEKEGVDYLRGKRVEISLDHPWPYQAEGEVFTEDTRVSVMEYLPNKLRLITHADDVL